MRSIHRAGVSSMEGIQGRSNCGLIWSGHGGVRGTNTGRLSTELALVIFLPAMLVSWFAYLRLTLASHIEHWVFVILQKSYFLFSNVIMFHPTNFLFLCIDEIRRSSIVVYILIVRNYRDRPFYEITMESPSSIPVVNN